MDAIEILPGEIHRDARGWISSLNAFRFEGVRRCYLLHHPDVSVIRGWNGHRTERKWFCCIKGAFTLGLVKIDDWTAPSKTLRPELLRLTETRSELVCVPKGYANGIKATAPDSILMVLSDKTLEESAADSYRYDANTWLDWSALE